MSDNALLPINKYPGDPASAFVLIANDDGSYTLSFNPSYNGVYPSDPTTITPGTPVSVSPVGEVKLQTTNLVNVNTGTPTPLCPVVPVGFQEVITRIVIRKASVSLTTAALSFGFNSASFNNVVSNDTYTELTTSLRYTEVPADDGASVGAAGQRFSVKANTPQGAAATVSIDVFGYLVEL